jgi:hypothetical protein
MTARKPQTSFHYKRGTTELPNATIRDERLDYPALGLLADILARPESAPQGYRAFLGRGLGQQAVLKALKQLGEAGYRHQITKNLPGDRSAVVTFTITAEESIPHDVAQAWLRQKLESLDDDRALEFHARRDLRKYVKETTREAKRPGGAVRDLPSPGEPMHGEPMHGEPMHGEPMHGQPPHKPSVSKGLSSLRSQDPGKELGDTPAEQPVPPPTFRAEYETRKRASGDGS